MTTFTITLNMTYNGNKIVAIPKRKLNRRGRVKLWMSFQHQTISRDKKMNNEYKIITKTIIMKKIMMTLAVALMMSGAAFAQSDNKQQGQRPSGEQMAQRMTEQMVSTYGLTDAQKTKLLALNKKYAGKIPMGGPRGGKGPGKGPKPGSNTNAKIDGQTGATQQAPSSEEMTKRRKEMQTNREAYNKELKKILSDSQYKKYTENEQSRMQRHETRGTD